jgi:hypothetical protein
MKTNMRSSTFAALVLGVLFISTLHSQAPFLPTAVSPSDVEIRMTRRHGGGGCYIRCVNYRVSISGDGTVRYEDLTPPPAPQRTRRVAVDDVVALANEFVRARFLEAPGRFDGESFYVLENGQLAIRRSGGADHPTWNLSFRLGTHQNSVHMELGIPDYLARLRDLVDKLGGPGAWTER